MYDQSGTNQLPHQHGQVRSDCQHAVLQVLVKLPPVLFDLDHLLAEMLNIGNVFSEISVPLEISAASFTFSSTSSGKTSLLSVDFP